MGRCLEWGDRIMPNRKMKIEISSVYDKTGEYIYTTLALPATDSEIEDAMQRARITEGYDDYIGINILEYPTLPEIEDTRLESPTIKELNFFASRMEKLSGWELAAARAIYDNMVEKSEENDDLISMKDLINMTYSLDSVPVMNRIGHDGQLGEYIIDNAVENYIKELSEEALDCLDAEEVGKKYREKENGKYMGGCYVGVGKYKEVEKYDGEHLPYEENPELGEGVFRLLVAKAPQENPEEVLKNAQWIALPIDRNDADKIAKSLGENCIEDCVYYDIRTGIPPIDGSVYTDMKQFDKLNKLAKTYSELPEAHKVCFKALLEIKSAKTIYDMLKIAEEEKYYNFTRDVVNAGDFAKMYLKYHLPAGFDYKFIDKLNVTNFADKLLDRLGADVTSYGIISGIGRSLFEIVPYDDPVIEIQQNNERMGGMEM